MLELIKIQGELDVPKGQYNSFGKYKFRSTEDILGAVKPLLTKYECFLTISDEIILIGDRYYVQATATLSKDDKSVTVKALAREANEQKGMNDSQLTGSTSSYARKYALSGLFAIDDEKDSDSTNTHDKVETKETKKDNTDTISVTISPGYTVKKDEDGLTLDDYIDSIKMEKDGEHVKTLYFKGLKLCTTDKQADFFTGIKDKRKKELGL